MTRSPVTRGKRAAWEAMPAETDAGSFLISGSIAATAHSNPDLDELHFWHALYVPDEDIFTGEAFYKRGCLPDDQAAGMERDTDAARREGRGSRMTAGHSLGATPGTG